MFFHNAFSNVCCGADESYANDSLMVEALYFTHAHTVEEFFGQHMITCEVYLKIAQVQQENTGACATSRKNFFFIMGRILSETTWKCYCCGKMETQITVSDKSQPIGTAPRPWSVWDGCCTARFCEACANEHPTHCPACNTSYKFIIAKTIALFLLLLLIFIFIMFVKPCPNGLCEEHISELSRKFMQ